MRPRVVLLGLCVLVAFSFTARAQEVYHWRSAFGVIEATCVASESSGITKATANKCSHSSLRGDPIMGGCEEVVLHYKSGAERKLRVMAVAHATNLSLVNTSDTLTLRYQGIACTVESPIISGGSCRGLSCQACAFGSCYSARVSISDKALQAKK